MFAETYCVLFFNATLQIICFHLERNHNIHSVANFLDESLAEVSRKPDFGAFCDSEETRF